MEFYILNDGMLDKTGLPVFPADGIVFQQIKGSLGRNHFRQKSALTKRKTRGNFAFHSLWEKQLRSQKGGHRKEENIMGAHSTITECEWGYTGEGYDPAEAAELCADQEGSRYDEERGEKGAPPWGRGSSVIGHGGNIGRRKSKNLPVKHPSRRERVTREGIKGLIRCTRRNQGYRRYANLPEGWDIAVSDWCFA